MSVFIQNDETNTYKEHELDMSPSDTAFLQSELWQKIQTAEGKKTMRVGDALVVEVSLPFQLGHYWYVPRYPMKSDASGWKQIRAEALKQNVWWIRVEPATDNLLSEIKQHFTDQVICPVADVQPRETLSIDLSQSVEEILADMKPKTRYNIGLSTKKGVEVALSREPTDIDAFIRLTGLTAQRSGIRSHGSRHYKTLVNVLGRENGALWIARYKGEVIAALLEVFYADVALYLHGSSSNNYRECMAPFALQWNAIQEAKRRGLRWYDLGGVNTRDSKSSLRGVTRFKQGFAKNPCRRLFSGAFDIILKPSCYRFYVYGQKIMRFLR